MTRLKSAKVPYQVEQGGRAIRVPADTGRRAPARVRVEGLPSSGRIGFEIFDRTAFGATEFLEQVNYRRAARRRDGAHHRDDGRGLQRPRPHRDGARLAVPVEARPAKASVVLKLRGNRRPPPARSPGIANLVARERRRAAPGSGGDPRQLGRPLARPAGDDDAAGGAQIERQQRIERDLTTRVAALLEPVVGAERVRVNVRVRLNPQSEEATEEKWDPTTAAIRSRQVTGDAGGLVVRGCQGWPARAQTCRRPCLPRRTPLRRQTPRPPPSLRRIVDTPNGPGVGRGGGDEHDAHRRPRLRDRELRISKVIRHTVRPRGEVARLSVAVILDNESVVAKNPDGTTSRTTHARKPEEIEIESLVAAAVGLDATRGDLLTIENVPFEEIAVEAAPKAGSGSASRRRPTRAAASWASSCSGRSRSSCSSSRSSAAPPWMPWRSSRPRCPSTCRATSRILEGEIEAQLDAVAGKSADRLRLPVLTRRLGTLTAKEPEHAARLLRMWMSQENR